MYALMLEGRRSGYTPGQCRVTLTVAELVGLLSDYADDTPVYLKNDNGYTYGEINYDSFEEEYIDD